MTHNYGVSHLSFSSLAKRLEHEIVNGTTAGSELRLDVIAETATTSAQRVLNVEQSDEEAERVKGLPASVLFENLGPGDVLLTTVRREPMAATIDISGVPSNPALGFSVTEDIDPNAKEVMLWKRRPTYEPSPDLSIEPPLGLLAELQRHGRAKRPLTDEVMFSQGTLTLLTRAHTALSKHTHSLGMAAAELFRQCERMLEEFRDQVKNVKEVAYRVESVVDEDGPDNDDGSFKIGGEEGIRRRIDQARSKQADLVRRYDALQRKEAALGKGVVSEKEEAWTAELQEVESAVIEPDDHPDDDDDENEVDESGSTIWRRYIEVTSHHPETNPGLSIPHC